MLNWLRLAGWVACAVYATVPAFWLMVHPFAGRWRARHVSVGRSPYRVLVPAWMAIWLVAMLVTWRWRDAVIYSAGWTWGVAVFLFAVGGMLYAKSGKGFSAKQLGGVPEVHGADPEQRLVTGGIRAHVRHPVYLAHLCEMVAWSVGTGLAVCWTLTAFAIVTGAVMIRMEDAELEKRFGNDYRKYQDEVPSVVPKLHRLRKNPARRLSCERGYIRYDVLGQGAWQVPVSALISVAEYTTGGGPLVDDYFLVFLSKDGLFHKASFYSDGRDEMLDELGASLGYIFKPGLANSTELASRIIWPPALKDLPLFVEQNVNPEVTRLADSRQL